MDEGVLYEDALRKYNLDPFRKAFPDKDDLERFIYLRATYFPLLLKVYKDTVLQVADDDDDDSNLETSRNILELAVNLMQQQNVLDDLGGL